MHAILSIPRSQQRRTQHLADSLQPFLIFQKTQQTKRYARIGGELLDCDPQKPRRAVDDEDAGAAVENPQLQTIQEDSGAARIIHHDVVFFQIGGQVVDDRIEVSIPAVTLHLVVGEAEAFDRLMSPLFVRYPIETARPCERCVLVRGRDHRLRYTGMQLEQIGDDPLGLPAPSAHGRRAELRQRTSGPSGFA